jgi:ketosteroid isomerase-like protein
MSQENVEAVTFGFKLWGIAVSDPDVGRRRQASQAMAATYSPDAMIDFSRTTPDYSATDGPRGMVAWMEEARGAFTDLRVELVEAIDAGEAVVASARISGRGASSGVPVVLDYAYVFGLSGGQIVSAVSYPTLAQALQAVGLER